jgi:hypothetical protein
MAANPLGAFLLLGLDITALSVAWPALPEIKKVIREFRIEDARVAAARRSRPHARDVTAVPGRRDRDVRGPQGLLGPLEPVPSRVDLP